MTTYDHIMQAVSHLLYWDSRFNNLNHRNLEGQTQVNNNRGNSTLCLGGSNEPPDFKKKKLYIFIIFFLLV